jgi:hypothetical protein
VAALLDDEQVVEQRDAKIKKTIQASAKPGGKTKRPK